MNKLQLCWESEIELLRENVSKVSGIIIVNNATMPSDKPQKTISSLQPQLTKTKL